MWYGPAVKRLLYIEDNPVTQRLLQRRLEQVAAVTTATSLAQARELLRGSTFELVIADVNLPDGISLDLVRELRKTHSPLQLPFILVSASMDQLLTVQALRAGANECFAMPTPWATFLAAVQRQLEAPHQRSNDLDAVAVTWVEGAVDDRLWLYSPELDLRLEGPDLELLRRTMSDQVRQALSGRAELPQVRCVQVTQRLVPRNHHQKPG